MRIVDYHTYPLDAASLLEEYKITKNDISEEARFDTARYLTEFLTSEKSDAHGEFELNGIRVSFQGWDAAANFLGCFE